MKIETIKTLGALKKSGYQYKTIKEELRRNLLQKLMKKERALAPTSTSAPGDAPLVYILLCVSSLELHVKT